MSGTITQKGGLFVKSYTGDSHVTGAEVFRRTNILHGVGVTTPQASFDPARNAIRLSRIDGPTIGDLCVSCGPVGRVANLRERRNILAGAMQALTELHAVNPLQLELAEFDPWRQTNRRLAPATARGAGMSRRIREQAVHQKDELQDRLKMLSGRCLMHGDFHAGQLIVETATERVWLLDLDDLCVGLPEADIANFAAHFVTSQRLYTGSIKDGFDELGKLLGDIYAGTTGHVCDRDAVRLFGAAALLRRALKLCEQEQSEATVLEILSTSRQVAN